MSPSSFLTTTVVQCCSVAPPPHTVAPATLPLTFFDVNWLLFSPIQPLFFFNHPTITTPHFTQSILPNLNHSLSQTLQHFFPLAGKLITPPYSGEPRIEYSRNDGVSVTIAEVSGSVDFRDLAGDQPRVAEKFHGLVPKLKNGSLLAVKITVFVGYGISIGLALNPVVADWRTFHNFLKTWASFCKYGEIDGGGVAGATVVASHDRCLIGDPGGLLKSKLLEDWRVFLGFENGDIILPATNGYDTIYDAFRATFCMGPVEMEKIKKRILTRSEEVFGSIPLLVSPYVVACALVWVCWIKTHWSDTEIDSDVTHCFGFIAGGLTRLGYPIPSTYVGNCVSFGVSRATRKELAGRNGILYAAKAIGDTIKRLNGNVLGGIKSWVKEWNEIRGSELHVMVTGSPKVDLYGLDFGWGGPSKIEEVSIDKTRAISLCGNREVVGGIDIGLVLPKSKIDVFTKLFSKGLC